MMVDALGKELAEADILAVARANGDLAFGVVNRIYPSTIGVRIFTEKSDHETSIFEPHRCSVKVDLEYANLPWELTTRMITYRDHLITKL